jgi:hypothetical protein
MWLDGGLRKVPTSSIVMRRSFFGPWRFVEVVGSATWRAVGRWPSLVLALVSTEPARARLSARQLHARLEQARTPSNLLRALGVITSVVLVIGAPMAVSRYGRAGLYSTGACLLTLGIVTALVSALACRRLGASGWSCVRFGATFLWPFSTPYAAERVLALALARGSPIDVLRLLAGAESFAQWARPHAYDALNRHDSREPHLLEGFDFQLDGRALHKLLSVLPEHASPDGRFCPRCGANFQSDVRACTDCAEVELVTSHPDSPSRRPRRRRKR